MLVNSVSSVADYVELLRAQPDEVTQLFKDLLIGVTHFFRDAESFDVLAVNVLPKILHGKTEDREVRVWVSGCASGEEAYSIAILLREAMGALDVAPTVKIFATDIDEHALEVARVGQYTEGSPSMSPPSDSIASSPSKVARTRSTNRSARCASSRPTTSSAIRPSRGST